MPGRPPRNFDFNEGGEDGPFTMPSRPTRDTDDNQSGGEEEFFDLLKDAVKVTAPAQGQPSNSNGNGPISFGASGSSITALSLIAFSTTGKLASSNNDSKAIDTSKITQRALLAEASLVAVTMMDHQVLQHQGFFQQMQKTTGKLMPVVKQAGPKILSVVKDDFIRLSAEQLSSRGSNRRDEWMRHPSERARERSGMARPNSKSGEESFLFHVVNANSNEEEEEEGPDSGVLSFNGVLAPASFEGLSVFVEQEKGKVGGGSVGGEEAFKGILARVVIAEAALQAAINSDHQVLAEEGFFDALGKAVQKLVSVRNYAPGLVKTIGALIGN